MSSIAVAVAFIIYISACFSGPCIPANTCFTWEVGNDNVRDDESLMFTCDSSRTVWQQRFLGNTECIRDEYTLDSDITLNGATGDAAGGLGDGDTVVGGSSGTYKTDYLQGNNCPVLDSPSEECTQYFVVKHRGDINNDPDSYLDIGDNCTAYLTDPSSFTLYNTVYLPNGCVEQNTGSKFFECNATSWSWTKYDSPGCTGNLLSDQSEGPWVLDECGYFYENHHIPGEESWWYWYDLVCCPDAPGKECVGSPEPTPTSDPTKAPTTAAGPIPTPQPTQGPNPTSNNNQPLPTPQPVQGQPSPTKAPHASIGGTPTTSAPVPTSPGTARPTGPTTPAPVDGSGNTAPTTAAPTSKGTTKPTKSPTDDSGAGMISMILAALCGVMMVLNV